MLKKEIHIVKSENQSGGTTAHTVTKNSDLQIPIKSPKRNLVEKMIKIILVLAAVVAILTFIFTKPWRSSMGENDEKSEIHIIESHNQSGGITAHTVNVNQQRAISRNVQFKKEKRGEDFLLQIILSQTQGIWNQGETFGLEVKTSGPYKTASIVRGLPGALMNVRTVENKEDGFFSFSTITAPLNNEVIVLEIVSKTEIVPVAIVATPLANKN